MRLQEIETARRFSRWLSECLDADVKLAATAMPSTGGGWSNETAIVDLVGSCNRRVVVRLQPDGPAMFRSYDLAREFAILQALGALGRPPVPKAIAIDLHGAVAGRSLFVMSYIEGRVPSDDRPNFAEAGWLFEASFEEQRTFSEALVAAIAEVHAVDWRHPRLVDATLKANMSLRSGVDWLRDLHLWGAGADLHPIVERAFARTFDRLPVASENCLLWGDARPANVVEAGFRPVALLDWELAGVGPVELDVAWFLEMNRMRTVGAGVAPLPGFLTDEEAVACYENVSGRRLAEFGWYRLYAALRIAVLMERHLRVAIARGKLRHGHRLLRDNVALRRLEALLEAAG